jgi:hypothetical protein
MTFCVRKCRAVTLADRWIHIGYAHVSAVEISLSAFAVRMLDPRCYVYRTRQEDPVFCENGRGYTD